MSLHVRPKPEANVNSGHAVGPCQQMKGGIFEGDDNDLMSRMYSSPTAIGQPSLRVRTETRTTFNT